MSRKALLVSGSIIGLIIIIAGLILIFGQKESSTQPETQNLVVVTRPPELGGWQLVTHPNFNITFKVPPAWQIEISDNGRGGINSYFSGAGTAAALDVNQETNSTKLDPDTFLRTHEELKPFRINRDSVQGIGHVTKETSEDDPSLIEDSYFLVNQYFMTDKILVISCGLSGPNYKTLIPTCEEIVGSLQFIR